MYGVRNGLYERRNIKVMEAWKMEEYWKYQHPGVLVVGADTTEATNNNYRHPAIHRSSKMSLQHYVYLGLFLLLTLMADSLYAINCPDLVNCHCEYNNHGKLVINCRNKDLSAVPEWTSADPLVPFYELTLAHNDITALDNDIFNGLNIKRLDLSQNPIMRVDNGAFNGLEIYLEELVFHMSAVDTFPRDALSRLTKLRHLTISGLNVAALPENALQTLTQLQELTLEKCALEVIIADDLVPLRNSLRTLSLPFNQLSQVPTNAVAALANLTKLDMQHNKLKTLNEGFLSQNAGITNLDFSNNAIATVHPNAFEGLEGSLKSLVLKSNRLTENQLPPMGILRNLENLNLAFNNIRNLHPLMLAEMQKLEILNLGSNHLSHLNEEPLTSVKNSLVQLDVSHNTINTIQNGLFNGFTKLKEIHLNDQGGSLPGTLSETTFQGLEGSLQRLSLGNVGFKTEHFPSVTNLGNLQWLSLRDNSIDDIPRMTFQHLSQLMTLDLTNNSISSLNQGALHGMQNSLVEIDLVSNNIQTLPECAFNEYSSLQRIKLGKNPLRCDCDLVWLREWISQFKNDILLFYMIDWKCQSPTALLDKKFREVSIGDLCDINPPAATCEVIQTSTTPPSPTASLFPQASTTPSLGYTALNVTHVSEDSVYLTWRTQDARITGFRIETSNGEGEQQLPQVLLGPTVRQHRLENLSPLTKYIACVTSQYNDQELDTKVCTNFNTLEESALPVTAGANVGVIVGSVIGVIAFIILLIILGFWLVRSRSDGDSWLSRLGFGKGSGGNTKKLRMPQGIPQAGSNSRRFSRPKGATASTSSSHFQNYKNQEMEKKLAGFSEEERDRILNMLTTTGGSTASMISTGSSTRYAPALPPRPQSMEGYLNPQEIKDEEDAMGDHIYSEIPAAMGAYEEPSSCRNSGRDSGISEASGRYVPYPEPNSGICYM